MLSVIQPSFNSGEISPSLHNRVDLDKYKSSLKTCRNFILHPQGGASNRCGMEFIATCKYATFSSSTISTEFIFSQTQAYTLEFGHYYVRFYRDGAQIQNNGIAYEVATPYLSTDVRQLRFESSADVIYITHPSYQTQTLTRYAEKDWRIADYAPEDGPFMPENIDESATLTASATTGTNVTLTLSALTTIDPYLVSLLHMNGVDASTTFTDTRALHTYTANGNAQIDTAQSKFGGASGLFDGSGDYISTPDSNDFFYDTGDFTIELWYRPAILSGAVHMLYEQWNGTIANVVQLYFIPSSGKIEFYLTSGGILIADYVTTNSVISDTASFHHIALVRSGSSIYIFVDGLSVPLDVVQAIGSTSFPNFTSDLYIGADHNLANYANGWMDEYRISKGIARYTEGFTVSNAEFSTVTTSALTNFEFDTLHIGALFKLRHYVEGQTSSTAFGSATSAAGIKCFTTWRLITHGTWKAKFNVEKSTDNGTTWTVLRSFSGDSDFNANTSGTEDIDTNPVPFLVRINVTSYTSGTLNADLTTDPFYQDGIVRVTTWNSVTSVQATVLQTLGSTTGTTSWAEGSWSDYRGYPAISRFFQDRLDFASTPSEPQTDWLSKTSNYSSFIRNSPLLDTDGITVNLPSRQLNAINGLLAFKKLLAFTNASVWSVGPITGTALTPTSVQQDIEEYSGSSGLDPVVIGTEALYVDVGGEIVRSIGFQIQFDGFVGNETNVLSKHLFEGYTILDMAFQRSPNSTIWFVRSDGVLLSLTYLKEQNVVAWAHHDTDGDVESINVIPGDNSDELWMVVDRDVGKCIERMQGRKQHDLTDHVFLDSYRHYDTSSFTLSTLTHLAGKVVSLVGDDVFLGTMTVSASGTLPMSTRYSSLDVGLTYNADLETLAINVPTREGNVNQSQIKIGNVIISLVGTRGGYIGPNENSLYEAFTYDELSRANQVNGNGALGTTEEFSGNIRVPLGSGFADGGSFFLRQSNPLPITVTTINPEITVGDKPS